MALGKAFIEVHADTKPFARELGRELAAIVKAAEKDVKASSNKLGSTISKETGKGVRKDSKQIGKGVSDALTDVAGSGVFSKFAKGIIDTIDDGLSGLPGEAKAALGGVLVAVLPLAFAIGSQLAGGIVAGLTLFGGAGLGLLLASQFQEVQDSARDTFAFLREQFLETAQSLVRPFLNALNLVRQRFTDLQPELVSLFARIGDTIVPLTDALIGFIEEFIPGFRRGFANIGPLLAVLQVGLRGLGQAAGNFFQVILENDDTKDALFDLLDLTHRLITGFTGLVDIGLDLYGVLRDVGEALGLVEEPTEVVRRLGKQIGIATQEQSLFGDAIRGTITPLEAQERAVKDLNRSLQDYINQQFEAINNRLDFEQALDDLTESVKENGRSLKESEQAGRDNARQLLDLARIALETRQNNIDMGLGVAEAERRFQDQRTAIFDLAKELKLSKADTDKLVGALLKVPPPIDTGVTPASLDRLIAAAKWAQTLASRIARLITQGVASVMAGAATPHAHGGVFTQPHMGLVAEAGPEAIIPLSNPARAAEVMSQAGLTSMMSPTVNVYIGNEQIQAYIAVETNKQMGLAARSLAYGTRGI